MAGINWFFVYVHPQVIAIVDIVCAVYQKKHQKRMMAIHPINPGENT